MDANPDASSVVDEYSGAPSSLPASRKNSEFDGHTTSALAVSPSYVKRELKRERDKTVDMIAKYVKEIEDLKRDMTRQPLVTSTKKKTSMLTMAHNVSDPDADSDDN